MRERLHGLLWLAALTGACIVLVSPLADSKLVGTTRVAAASSSAVATAFPGAACAPAAAAAAQEGAGCSACWQCVNRDGPTDRCLAICDRLGCDPGGGNPRPGCDAIGLCVEGFHWDFNACMCLPDHSGIG